MDITLEVYQAAVLFRYSIILVNVILVLFALKQLPSLCKLIFELVDYIVKRQKISRGHSFRKYKASQEAEGGEKDE